MAFSNEIVTFPVDPDFSSLNIAQSVLLLAYEFRRAQLAKSPAAPIVSDDPEPRATWGDQERMFLHLESALDAVSYFRHEEKKPSMSRNLRVMLTKGRFSEAEVQTLRGVISALEQRPGRPRKKDSDD
jgi:tRNA/rRNA methyltransferase